MGKISKDNVKCDTSENQYSRKECSKSHKQSFPSHPIQFIDYNKK